jgi:hypothetical protein
MKVSTIERVRRATLLLDEIPREDVKFDRSTRQHLSSAEVAEAAMSAGLDHLLEQHGIPIDALSEVRDD